ncbi:MAG: MFS transporter [Actinomycetaceae bacterium]|nr:MFS transporter [Actinomycetaceae bacterium]
MFGAYRKILSYPGALNFSAAGLVSRIPMAMIVIAIVLMISGIYDNYQLAGQVSAVNILGYALVLPFLSRLIDRHGQARIMIPSVIISVLTLLALAVLASNHAPAWQLFIAAFLSGATEGNFGSLVRARWAAIATNSADLHTAFALEATIDEFCFVTGPLLATYLATSLEATAAIWCSAIITIAGGTWFLSQRSSEPHPEVNAEDEAAGTSQGSVMKSGTMISLALVFCGAGTMFGGIDISVVAFCEETGQKSAAGVVLAALAFGSLLGGLLYGAHTWSLSILRRFVAGVLILGAGASLLYFAHNLPMLTLLMFCTGFFIAPTMTNVTTIVQTVVRPTRLTEGLAWMSTGLNTGIALGANFAGRVVEHYGVRSGFFLIAACAWMMAIIAVVTAPVIRRSLRKAHRRKVHGAIVAEELEIDAEKRDEQH